MKPSTPQRPATRLLVSLLYRSRWALAVATVACVVNGVASVSLVTQINHALTAPPAELSGLAWRFVALAVLALVSRVVGGVVFAQLSQGTMAKMRKHISARVALAPFRQVETLGAPRAQSIVTEDATNVSMLFFALPNIVMHGSIVAGCLGYLAWLSWPVFLLALAVVVVGSLGYHLGDARALSALEAAGAAQDRLFAHFNALFSGAKELKLHRARAGAFVGETLGGEIDAVRRHRTRAFAAYAFGVGWIVFLFYVFLGLVVFAPAAVAGLDAAVLAGYVIIFLFMLVPLDGLLNNIPTLNVARVSLARIEEMLAELPEPAAESSPRPFGDGAVLKVSGLTHSYYREKEDDVFQLGPIDLELRRGEVSFLIGGNGSGKTTLAKLLTGLYAPEGGSISLDGRAVDEENRADYRQLFSAVFSDFHLFETLVGLGDPELDARANALIAKLHLDHKVKIENGRFSTRELSQGQRKRLALVVAYLEDRPFYLFDEWAADQDPLFKAVFYQELLPELAARGKAVLAITHDDRYFHLADHRLKLESGKLVVDERREAPAETV
ncbi:cyclic peptide export ABC transporter [Crenobacter luteus]|uniref:Peptide ABC transporter ATP-binding protein n=1 Tax=Crenobacter luteus TaxID=1452487 RepID=A0A161SB93_9NEIS|nr:cyclic peptide export ABC transporter [Crenobacter luteus]KZE25393.1 peptide ABC transporter ATP-binding protein [Crenobacter luteus]